MATFRLFSRPINKGGYILVNLDHVMTIEEDQFSKGTIIKLSNSIVFYSDEAMGDKINLTIPQQ